MDTKHVLYGLRVGRIQEVAATLSGHLTCTFDDRESDYFGEYCLARTVHGELRIVAQPDPEGEPFEDQFEEYQVLIYSTVEGDGPGLDGVPVGKSVIEKLRG